MESILPKRLFHGLDGGFVFLPPRYCLHSSQWPGVRMCDFLTEFEKEMVKFRTKLREALPGSDWSPLLVSQNLPPEQADIVIVGGGIMGWSIAYWLKMKEPQKNAIRVVVVERDLQVSRPRGKQGFSLGRS